MTSYDDRPLWPGTRPPVSGAMDRRAGSVRRTTSVDIVRPDGARGPLVVSGVGRDLVTGDGGAHGTPPPIVAARASTEVIIDYLGDRTVTAVHADPAPDGLEVLVGRSAGSGFRRAMAEALPELVASGSLVHQLLDDVTPATLISGSSLARDGLIRLAVDGQTVAGPFGICAGWQHGGAMEAEILANGVPLLGLGPTAPTFTRADDPWASHDMGSLPPGSLRRCRVIDVGPGDARSELEVLTHFRDSYWEPDHVETVVHEYRVRAVVDPATWTITAVSATAGPLPAPECPAATASADRLVGCPVGELRQIVREQFTGTSTCTHLNDVFRSLADIGVLAGLV